MVLRLAMIKMGNLLPAMMQAKEKNGILALISI
jgi:hypothetical protein